MSDGGRITISGDTPGGAFDSATPVRLAVFDFDGTCLHGNSPVMLCRDLFQRRMITKRQTWRLVRWGIRYVCHLPREKNTAFSEMFSAFEGWPSERVDAYLHDLYSRTIRPNLRAGAIEAIRACHERGEVCALVSATFGQLVSLAKDDLGIDHVVCAFITKDECGNYTGFLDGDVEGKLKVEALTAFANRTLGEHAWTVDSAYADHVSDIPVLCMAAHASVVSPSPLLWISSKLRGWSRLNW